MDLAKTLRFFWTPNGALPLINGATPTMYTDPIPTEGADQIALLVITTPSGSGLSAGTDVGVYIRVAWAGELPDTGNPTLFCEECVESQATYIPGTGVQRYGVLTKEYGPIQTNPATRATIWIPTAVHYFKIGCYADANPSLNAAVTILVERGRTSSPVLQGR